MKSDEVVEDVKMDFILKDDPFCEGCVYGKQHRKEFPKGIAKPSNKPGEIFHIDLCGRMNQPTLGGANYFMICKDDCTRYCFIYFLKNKTDVLENLKRLVTEAQADGFQVKRIRTDGDLEFCNTEVNNYLLSKDIKHEKSRPRAPEQNGFIERQNRTVLEAAKTMLHSKGLPLYLWAEAASTAVYLRNRCSSETLNGKTPFEKWFGARPSVSHLRIFGSEFYAHVPKEQRTKWEINSVKCIFVGYTEGGNKAYRIYDPKNRKIMIRRDVILNELSLPSHTVTDIIVTQVNGGGKSQYRQNQGESVSIENKVPETQTESEEEVESLSEPKKTVHGKNPRLPIPRDPSRRNLKSTRDLSDRSAAFAQLFLGCVEPVSVEESLAAEDTSKWLEAINSELDALEENKTWTLVSRTQNTNIISNRWVFKRKYRSDGTIDKVRLVVRSCLQKQGIDYTETFAPVVSYTSVRLLIAVSASLNLDIYQFDVQTAFLHGDLDEPIYMEQPYGFAQEDRVCLLNKSLYGLKQAPRQWNKETIYLVMDLYE